MLSPATPPVSAKTVRGSSEATKHAPAVAIIAAVGQGLQAQCQWGACPEVEVCVGVEPGIIGARWCCVVLGRPDISLGASACFANVLMGYLYLVLYFACVWFGHGVFTWYLVKYCICPLVQILFKAHCNHRLGTTTYQPRTGDSTPFYSISACWCHSIIIPSQPRVHSYIPVYVVQLYSVLLRHNVRYHCRIPASLYESSCMPVLT